MPIRESPGIKYRHFGVSIIGFEVPIRGLTGSIYGVKKGLV